MKDLLPQKEPTTRTSLPRSFARDGLNFVLVSSHPGRSEAVDLGAHSKDVNIGGKIISQIEVRLNGSDPHVKFRHDGQTFSRQHGNDRLNRILGYLLASIVTLDMVWSRGLLLQALPSHRETPKDLLISAAALWITNILVFASWHWRLDAGGPRAPELREVHADGAFLFPQMTLDQQSKRDMGEPCWSPGFIDYLFLAFNTSTAFSPTDTPVLSPWANVMVMIQALISVKMVASASCAGRQYSLVAV